MIAFLSRWNYFFQNLIKNLLFFLLLYTVLRSFFLAAFWELWWSESGAQLLKTFWYGFRINLKSAGIGVLIWLLFSGLPSLFLAKIPTWLRKLGNVILSLWISLIWFIGLAEIPYYQYLGSGYDYMLFQGANESLSDLFVTLLPDWQIWFLLFIGMIGSYFWVRLWKKWMKFPVFPSFFENSLCKNLIYSFIVFLLLITLGIYCRFGGSLTYSGSLHWENYAVVGNDTLDEAILDSTQGLYRAWKQRKLLEKNSNMTITKTDIQGFLQELNPQKENINSPLISDYLRRTSEGAKIQKPRHIFIILGESQGEWPLYPEYDGLHIADGIKKIIHRSDSVWIQEVLPNGPYTPMGLQSVVIGLADAKQNPQFQKESYGHPYETGIAPQLAKLGYESNFWYGGPSTWEKIENFVEAQGFSHFYSMGELKDNEKEQQNVWGISDHDLYSGILHQFSDSSPSINVILTTSNHAPFSIDYIGEGFPLEEVKKVLPPERKEDQRLLDRLGHYWYADREMATFVAAMRERYPDSLFILTGDHGMRLNIEGNPSLQRNICIPIVISGPGISSLLFPPNNTASQLQIVPTLIELIAPQNFSYYSLLPSLTEKNSYAANGEYWMVNQTMGSRLNSEISPARSSDSNLRNPQWEKALLGVSWWRVMKGNSILP